MKRRAIGIGVITALLLSGLANGRPDSSKNFVLVENGKPASVIVVNDNPTVSAEEGIKELNYWIQRISGTELPILQASQWDGTGAAILVGDGPWVSEKGWTVEGLSPEAARVIIEPDCIGLLGVDIAPFPDKTWMGTYYAVLEFVRYSLGVRWIWPGELGEVFEPRTNLHVEPRTWTWETELLLKRNLRPAYSLNAYPVMQDRLNIPLKKEEWERITKEENQWRKRSRVDNSRPGYYRSGHSFTDWWERHSKDHPDWFAKPPEGVAQMTPHHVKFNLTNQKLQDQIIQEWKRERKSNPEHFQYLRLARNDSAGYDTRPETRAWDAPELSRLSDEQIWRAGRDIPMADRYVRFWNIIARRVREIDPNAFVSVYAYGAQQYPPLREISLESNVVVEYTGGEAHYPDEPHLLEQWLGWSNLGAKQLIWRPNLLHAGAGLPYVFSRQIHNDLKTILHNGCAGIDFDAMQGNWAGQGLNYYVIAELIARPDAPYEEIVAEYFGAFGPAADAIREYFQYMEEVTAKLPEIGRKSKILSPSGGWGRWNVDFIRLTSLFLTPEVVTRADRYLSQAESLATESIFKERVTIIRQHFEVSRIKAETFRRIGLHERRGWADMHTFADQKEALAPLWEARNAIGLNPWIGVIREFSREQHIGLWAAFVAQQETPTRGKILPLRSGLSYRTDPYDQGLQEEWQSSEHSLEQWQPAIETSEKSPITWYRLVVPIPELGDMGGNILLRIESLEGDIQLWVNGELVLNEESVQVEYAEANITRVVHTGADNVLILRLANKENASLLPDAVSVRVAD